MRKRGDRGFLGLTVPEEYGGAGGDHLSYALVAEELGRGDSAVRGIDVAAARLLTVGVPPRP